MKSETIGELAKGLNIFQTTLEQPKLTKMNPFFKSKYADLNDVIEAIRPALKASGLSFVQQFDNHLLVTTLLHQSGEWISSTLPLEVEKKGNHSLGSSITYARRYSLCSLLGIVADPDDDGNASTHHKATQNRPAPQKNKFTGNAAQSPADYIVKLQSPFLGKKLRECDPAHLTNYLRKLVENASNPQGDVKALIDNAREFLRNKK